MTLSPDRLGARGPGLLFALVGLCLALLVYPSDAAAHAALESSTPAHGDVLGAAPDSVSATYTERLEQSYSRLELFDRTGAKVDGTTLTFGSDGYSMQLALPPNLPNGTYSIGWRTLSRDDGHTAQNYIAFTIGTNADIAPVVLPGTGDPDSVPQWAKTGSRWAALIGAMALIACWPVWSVIVRPALAGRRALAPSLVPRMRRFVLGAVIVAVLGSISALAVQAWALPDGSFLDKVINTLGQTRYGHLWLARFGLIVGLGLVLGACGWWFTTRRQVEGVIAWVLAAAVTLPFSLIAHASAQVHGRTVAVVADAAHLAASAVWAGGVMLLALVVLPGLRNASTDDRSQVFRALLPRFSTMALICMAVMGVTGFYAGWLEVGNLAALTSTDYGQALIAKLAILAVVIVLAAINLAVIERRIALREASGVPVWTRRLRWTLAGELVGILLLVAAVGQMTSLQPSRDVVEERARQVEVSFSGDPYDATLLLAPGTAGPNHFRLELDGPEVPDDAAVLLRLTSPESANLGTKEVQLSRVAGNAFEHHGSELSIAADWDVTVIVREQAKAPVNLEAPVSIGTERSSVDVPGEPWRFRTLGGLTGLGLVLVGLASAIVGVRATHKVTRKESIGLGGAALLLGAILLVQARIDPVIASADGEDAINPDDVAMVERGEAIYTQQCLSCHGANLRGDGPASAGMQPPPADFSDPHTIVHSESDLIYWVKNGKQGTAMPAFGDTLSDQDIRDVLSYIQAEQESLEGAPATPAAAACTVAPLTIDDLASRTGASAPESAPVDAAGAQPASEAQVAGVTETTNQLIACTNQRDTLRRLALFSDRSITASFGAGLPEGFEEAAGQAAEPLPAGEQVSLSSITGVQVLADGRIVATVTVSDPGRHLGEEAPATASAPGAGGTVTARVVFVYEGGRWLIDEIQAG